VSGADLEQLERNAQVVDLLDKSYQAHVRGDIEGRNAASDAAAEVDATVYVALTGAMMIGAVPRPDVDPIGWGEYVAAIHDKLAEAREDRDNAEVD